MLIVKNIENNAMYNMQELHSYLFSPTIFTSSIIIEKQLRVVVLTKLDKSVNPVKNIFNKSKHFIILYYSFS